MRKSVRFSLVLLGLVALATPVASVHAGSSPSEKGDDNLDIVVLVDESRSLSKKDVEAERSAVTQIVNFQLLFDRNIRFSIVPFSSGAESPRTLPGCESVPLTEKTSSILTECANQIVRQTVPSKSNTDFASALRMATKKLTSGSDLNRLRAVILLTDGQYDPDGDTNPSDSEEQALDAALAEAEQERVSIWALGFGKANLKALSSYSAKGAQVPSQCADAPKSSIASVTELDLQMETLVASLTCTDPPQPPTTTPVDLKISPLLTNVSMTVTSDSGNEPVVIDGLGKDPCDGMWKKSERRLKTFECFLSLDGSNAGSWSIRTDRAGQLTYQVRGELTGSLESCNSAPQLRIGRLDGKAIEWQKVDSWPVLNGFLVGDSGNTLKEFPVSVNAAELSVEIPGEFKDETSRLEFELPRDSRDSLVYSLPRISCDVKDITKGESEPTDSTTTDGKGTGSKGSNKPNDVGSDSGGLPRWLWILIVLVMVALGVVLYRVRRSRLFPAGTVVLQESQDKPGTFVELDGEVAGKRRVSLRQSGGRFLSLEPYGDSADITLMKSGLEVQVEYPIGEVSDDGEVEIMRTTVPFGIALKVQGFVIRVDVPEGIDDEF
jgi:hypothetical protein